MAATLDELRKQIDQLRREYQDLTGDPAALFDVNNISQANAAIRTLDGSIDAATRSAHDLEKGFGGVYSEINGILGELNKSESAANKTTKAFKGIERVARDLKDDQQGYNKLSIKELQDRQKKLKSAKIEANFQASRLKEEKKSLLLGEDGNVLRGSDLRQRLQFLQIAGDITEEEQSILNGQEEGFSVLERTNEQLQDRIDKEQRINESMGLGGAILGSVKGALDKLGMGGLADKLGFDEASKEMRKLTEELTNGGETTLDFAGKAEVLKAGFSSMGGSLLKNLKDPLSIGLMIVNQLVDAFTKVDKLTGETAKNLGISYKEANAMVSDMNDIANSSGDTHLNTENLVKSQLELSKALGTNATLGSELLTDFTKLTEQAGYSVETMTALGKITQSTGGDLSDNTAEILGTAKAFNVTNKLALNEKEIVAEVAKTSAATVLTFGRSADALAKNVMQAKKFGLNLQQAEAISSSLLNFQSSIEDEMSAELLTGKSLNFENARMLALQGKTGEAAAEVAKQLGSAEDFGRMNVIQQEALAKAAGMTRDELASSLIEREALAKVGMADLSSQEAYNELRKQGLSDDEIANKLGDENLAKQMKSESAQERMTAATEKLKEVFVSIAVPLGEIISLVLDVLIPAIGGIMFVLNPILKAFGGIKDIISSFFDPTKSFADTLAEMGPVVSGLAVAFGIIGTALLASIVPGLVTAAVSAGALAIEMAAAAIASITTASATTLGIGIIAVVAGIAAAVAAMNSAKADDLMSPGYGKRVLSSPEGTFALNDKDTVVAGTDLNQDIGGNETSSTSSPSINLTPLVEQMNAMNATLNAILNKEGTVMLDSTKVGTALSVGSYKLQ